MPLLDDLNLKKYYIKGGNSYKNSNAYLGTILASSKEIAECKANKYFRKDYLFVLSEQEYVEDNLLEEECVERWESGEKNNNIGVM